MKQVKVIIEKHPDGYVAYPVGVKGVVVGEGDSYEDALRDVQPQSWRSDVHQPDHLPSAGVELQNIVHAGEAFEQLIDHPAWIDYMHEYVGEEGSFMPGVFIDECFATIRGEGGFVPLHSGGHEQCVRNQYRFGTDGRFHCG